MEDWREIAEQPVQPDEKTLRDVFDSCIVPCAGARFRGEQFRLLSGPCVYMFFAACEPLYIGVSSLGVARPAGRHHMEIARQEADEVLIWPCRSEELAVALEGMLLSRIDTKYNHRYRGSFSHEKVAPLLGMTPHTLLNVLGSRFQRPRIVKVNQKKTKVLRWHDLKAV